MWSDKSYFNGKLVEISEGLHMSQVRSLLNGAVSTHEGQYVNTAAQSKPEVVVAFVFDKMSSADAFSASFVQTSMSAASSSVVAPFVLTGQESMSSLLETVANGAVSSSQLDAAHPQGCEQALSNLQASTFSNKVTDLVVVKADQTSSACLERVMKHIRDNTNGDFIAVVTAEAPSSLIQTSFEATPTPQSLSAKRPTTSSVHSAAPITTQGVANNQWGYPGVTKMNSGALIALLISGFLLLILLIGVCCLGSVETPVRFAHQPMPVGKEY